MTIRRKVISLDPPGVRSSAGCAAGDGGVEQVRGWQG
jgi:hypothetical protein